MNMTLEAAARQSALDVRKHRDLFDPDKWNEPALVIGAGATGNMVALELAKLGLTQLSVVDFDKLEAVNIANQLSYDLADVGKYKVDALQDRIEQATRTNIMVHKDRIGPAAGRLTHKVVFFCIDTMKDRKAIWQHNIGKISRVEWLIDLRINTRNAIIYSFDPRNPIHRREYENPETLYDDSTVPVELGSCGATMSMGPTAALAASMAAWAFVDYTNKVDGPNEIIFTVGKGDWRLFTRKFE